MMLTIFWKLFVLGKAVIFVVDKRQHSETMQYSIQQIKLHRVLEIKNRMLSIHMPTTKKQRTHARHCIWTPVLCKPFAADNNTRAQHIIEREDLFAPPTTS